MDTITFTLKHQDGAFMSYTASVPEDMNADTFASVLEDIMRSVGFDQTAIDRHIHYDITKIQFNSTE